MVQITSITELSNQVAAITEKKDERYQSLIEKIETSTELLLSQECTQQSKYDTLVSCEYLLVKLRLDIEFEHLTVKKMLNDTNTPASLRGHFLKRDQYLAQMSLKLNSIREDISVLQKVVYVQTTRKL